MPVPDTLARVRLLMGKTPSPDMPITTPSSQRRSLSPGAQPLGCSASENPTRPESEGVRTVPQPEGCAPIATGARLRNTIDGKLFARVTPPCLLGYFAKTS